MLGQGYGVVALHPFGLSYYNVLVGGLPGAERLGLELTYWGDAVDPVLLDRLARRAPARTRPPRWPPRSTTIQATATTTRAMIRRRVVLEDEDAAARADWLVVSRRTAYWRPDWRRRPAPRPPRRRPIPPGGLALGLWELPETARLPLARPSGNPYNTFRTN